jgi:hypothetical protein
MHDYSLNALGILCGTDKGQLGFDYLRHYERAFAGFRNLPMNFIEIGVADGASTKMWEWHFHRAQIIGVDIQERCRQYEGGRVKIEIGSQSDGAFIDALLAKYPPTILIDDGSHMASDIIFTFERAFPAILPGGCYVIEDLYFHKEADKERWRGTSPIGAQNYLLEYMRRLMDNQPMAHETHHIAVLAHSIDRIEAAGNMAFIWKKEPADIDYGWLFLLVQKRAADGGRGAATIMSMFAGYVLRTGGPADIAERAARIAVEGEPDNWGYQATLARALEKIGDIHGAIACFDKAAARAPEPWRSEHINNRDRLSG